MDITLFIYGTLQDPKIQMEVLGRICEGEYGLVDNYILLRDWNVDGAAHPRLFPHSAGCVIGQIIKVSEEELELLDEYETDSYRRDTIYVKNKGKHQAYFPNTKKGLN